MGALPNTPLTPNENNAWFFSPGAGQEWLSVFNHIAEAQMFSFPGYDDTAITSDSPGIGYPKMVLTNSVTNTNPNKYLGGIVVGYEPAYYYIKGRS